MANISQKISSYVFGVSQQPDHLKKAGQVRHLLNALPDVTDGLIKRPGSEMISDLGTVATGKWFTIFRDAKEKYICQVADGGLRVWSLLDGLPRIVRYNSTPDLSNPEDGGVGIDSDFTDDVDGTRPDAPNNPPTTPPPTGGSPGIPSSCDLSALTNASNNLIDATNDRNAANTNYQNAINDYNHKAANVQYIGVVSVCQPPVYNTYGQGGVWIPVGRPQVAPDGYQLGPRKYYAQLKWPGQANLVYQYGYDLLGTLGTYTQAQVDAAAAVRDSAYNALVAAEQYLVQAQQAYATEEAKCKASTFSTRSTRSAGLVRNVAIPYLEGTTPDDVETLSLNDYTFLVNKKVVVSMGKDASNNRPHEAFVEIKNLEYNTEYSLTLTKPSSSATRAVTYAKSLTVTPADWQDEDGNSIYTDVKTFDRNDGSRKNLRYTIETRGNPIPDGNYDYDAQYRTYITLINGGQGWAVGDTWTETMKGKTYTIRVDSIGYKYTYDALVPITPYLTPKDPTTGTLKPEAILDHFKAEIAKNANWATQIIGNGLYIIGPEEFSVYVSGGRSDGSIAALTNKVNNIAKLPIQCKDGYLVQVLNTGEVEDDYYVKFVGTREGVDGSGAWEETVAPGVTVNLNYTTMPHQIVRMPDGTFMVSPVDWEKRLVGDRKTNPVPSFVGRNINKLFFYRNRMGILSDENVILSRAGDYFNFFNKTALSISDSDPIDLATSSTTPCVLHDAVPINPGLILFSRDKQFILTTSQDLLTPNSSKLDTLATYNCSEILPAFEMGTTVGFLAQSGKFSRMWEMTGLNQQGTPEVIEQSKIVQEFLPNNITDIANAKDNTLILFAVRGTKDVYCYRYFNDGEKRIQSSWFKWTCPGDLVHHAVDDDVYYNVCVKDNRVMLAKIEFIPSSSQTLVTSSVTYAPRLDLRYIVPQNAITYDFITRTSSFDVPYEYTTNAYVFGLDIGRFQGRGAPIKSIVANGTKWRVTVPGDWSKNSIAIGYQFTMEVTLPTFYYTSTQGERSVTDTRMYTNVHRIKFEFGKVGLFDITVNKVGKTNAHSQYEQSPADNYDANTHEVLPTAIHTVPVYEKNLNFYVDLKSTYPTPCTLLSSMWEGTVSPKSYKSV